MRYELAQQFSDFKLPDDIKQAQRAGMIGSLGFTKMIVFANQVQLTNDDIDYFVSCSPRKMEDETYEDMKLRGKFTKKLTKYRAHLYDYSVYEK